MNPQEIADTLRIPRNDLKLCEAAADAIDSQHGELCILRARVSELESFAFYVIDHSEDFAMVVNASRVLGK